MNSPDEILNIDTPENVVFDYSVAGLGSRFMAALLDTFYIVLLQVVVFFVGSVFLSIALSISSDQFSEALQVFSWVQAVFVLLSFFLLWGYYIFFEVRTNGQSPGKRWARIRVIRTDGTPMTLSESVIRNLVRLIDFLPFAYAFGVIAMFVDGQSRRLGDLAAGTLVVHDSDQSVSLESLGSPVEANYGVYRPSAPGIGPLPVERLSEADIQIADDFLKRRDELTNAQDLAARILNRYLVKMELPEASFNYSGTIQLLKDIIRASRGQILERAVPAPIDDVGVISNADQTTQAAPEESENE